MADNYTLSAKLTADAKPLIAGFNKATESLANVQRKFDNAGKGMKGFGDSLQNTGKKMTVGLTAPVAALTGALFKTGLASKAFNQESKQAFTVLLGSAEAAEEHMDNIMKFAKTTPFAFPDLVAANRKLVSFGVSAGKTEPIMEAIANSVAAMGGGGEQIETLSDVFAKITANGKITGEELNRLSDNGINALAILANQAGVDMDSMRKSISKGSIESEQAIEWLVDGMMNGTKGINGETVAMGGSLDALKDTWKGAVDSMRGAWRRAGEAIISDDLFAKMTDGVKALTGVINQLPALLAPLANQMGGLFISAVDGAQKLINMFFALSPNAQQVALKIAAIVIAMGPLLTIFGLFFSVLGSVVSGLALFLTPVGLVLVALTALGVGIGIAMLKSEEFRNRVISAFNTVRDIVGNVISGLIPILQNMWSGASSGISSFISNIGNVLSVISTVFSGALNIITSFIGGLTSGFGEAGGSTNSLITMLLGFNPIMKIVMMLLSQFAPQISSGFQQIASLAIPIVTLLGQTLGQLAAAVIPMVMNVVSNLIPIIMMLASTIFELASKIIPIVLNLFMQLVPVVMSLVQTVIGLVSQIVPLISLLISSLVPVFMMLVDVILNIVQAVAPALIAIIGAIIAIFQAIIPVVMLVLSVIINVVSAILSALMPIIAFVAMIITTIISIIAPIVTFIAGIIASIFKVITPIITFVTGVFNTIFTIITGTFSSVMQYAGKFIQSISNTIAKLSAVFSGIFNGIWSTVSSIMDRVSNKIQSVFTAITTSWTGLKAFVSNVFSGIGDNMKKLVDKVKGFVNDVIGGINSAISIINKIPGVSVSKIPQLQRGTDNWAGGFAKMNEGGRGELAMLPSGTQVIPHDVSMKYAREAGKSNSRQGSALIASAPMTQSYSSNQPLQANLIIDGEKVAQKTFKYTDMLQGKGSNRSDYMEGMR